ncbi:MAG: glycerol-3-phosphate acyltransferase [Sedimentisphaerales bacterium]|nr:glycerol-3-phosphate acyltransferase [Sedimentisphaerales bacterium]
MAYSREILVVLIAYLIGCISNGYYLTLLWTGKDIRKSGSSSTGAKNVGRVLGKKGFYITLALDFLKGVAALLISIALKPATLAISLSIAAVTIGHIWPIQLKFKGGKGIAVSLGAMLVFDYYLVVLLLITFTILQLCLKKYVISGLVGFGTLPISATLLDYSIFDFSVVTALCLIIIFAHRNNILQFVNETFTPAKSGIWRQRSKKND